MIRRPSQLSGHVILMPRQVAPTPRIDPHYSRFRLKIRRSRIQGLGVFAGERIPRGRKVIEFTGKRVLRSLFDRRVRGMSATARRGLIHLGWLNNRWVVDAAIGGSGAEFINHSCESNLSVRRIHNHMLYFSRRTIRSGEELTATYRPAGEGRPVPCSCGSPRCRGFIT
jgi:SET domain-containing protein